MSASRAFSNLPVSLRIALRELRGGLSGFRIFLACLILGVAAIAGVGSLTRAINTGLEEEGQILLGGDVGVRILRRATTTEELAFFEQSGEVSQSVRGSEAERSWHAQRSQALMVVREALAELHGD